MKEIFNIALTYSGEALVAIAAFVVRSIEIRFMIRKKRKEWESGEQYSKIKKDK